MPICIDRVGHCLCVHVPTDRYGGLISYCYMYNRDVILADCVNLIPMGGNLGGGKGS